MDKKTAKRISETGHVERVTYNGDAVYIQRVNEEENTARIFRIDDPQDEFDVELANLNEH